jgi:ketosteroid isomerase-like protein
MAKNQPLDVARGMINAFNARDWNRLSELTAPNAVYDEVATGRKLTGRDDILEALKGWASRRWRP